MRRLRAPLWLVPLAMAGFTGDALAYDSKCRVGSRECLPGLETARRAWNASDSEHYHLWNDAIRQRGLRLPSHLSSKVRLNVPSVGGVMVRGLEGASFASVAPHPFAEADMLATREYAIAEMTQLPDLSYSLWDWAMGNEGCPILPNTPSDVCHDFAKHTGAVNSNHFLPQARRFYEFYHDLALSRAATCANMRSTLGTNHVEFVQACDQLAFTFEAIAHHYLQDAWSMGHMWERWGGPNPSDFGGSNEWRPKALLLALTAGLIHGARGVLQPAVEFRGITDVLDPMCAPLDPAEHAFDEPGWASLPPPSYVYAADGSTYEAVGDLYLSTLRSEYGEQYGRVIDCSVSSINQVAQAAGLGAFGSSPAAAPGSSTFNAECFDQRATNSSMYLGAGIDVIIEPIEPIDLPVIGRIETDFHLRIELDGRLGSRMTPTPLIDRIPEAVRDFLPDNIKDILTKGPGELAADIIVPPEYRHLVPMDASTAEIVILLAGLKGVVVVPEPLKNEFRNDMAALGPVLKAQAMLNPGGTNMATDRLPFLLGMPRNGAAQYQHDPPADYLDPAGVYTPAAVGAATGDDDAARGTVLGRAYHRAHALEWCDELTVADLEALRANAGADCDICEEFAVRHLRIGAAGAYDTTQEPVCNFLSASQTFIYQAPPAGSTATTLAEAAEIWCGCAAGGARCEGQFAGRIVDAETRAPIPQAAASFTSELDEGQVAAGDDGSFVSPVVSCGEFSATLGAPGYLPADIGFAIGEAGSTTQLIELAAVDEACLNEPAQLQGLVRDAITGVPIVGATVELRTGLDAPATVAAQTTVTTDTAGSYEFAELAAGYFTVGASAPEYQPGGVRGVPACGASEARDIHLMPLEERPLSFVLSWARPNDMDLHVLLPNGDEVSFGECAGSLSEEPFVRLDVDHRETDGPEAITVGQFSAGVYTLYVHNFSAQNDGESGFAGSEAEVVVYENSVPVETFSVPTAGDGFFWDVLEFEGQGVTLTDLRPINVLTNNRANPFGEGEYSATCTPAL